MGASSNLKLLTMPFAGGPGTLWVATTRSSPRMTMGSDRASAAGAAALAASDGTPAAEALANAAAAGKARDAAGTAEGRPASDSPAPGVCEAHPASRLAVRAKKKEAVRRGMVGNGVKLGGRSRRSGFMI